MKITDPQVIEDGEKDLIEAVQEDLDLDVVRQILRDRMGVSTLSSKGGQIVVHNNKIAFRLDFDINLSGSLLFDREGNYINDSGEDATLDPEMDQELDPEIELNGLDVDTPLIHDELEDPLSDEIPLVDTGLDETDLDEEEMDEEFSIDLPEYDLEDEPEYESEPADQDDPDKLPLDLETDLLPDESDQATELYAVPESNDPDTENLEDQDLEDDSLLQEEKLDEDINDILKESREFWEQKKDS